jgi:hypothetical protein
VAANVQQPVVSIVGTKVALGPVYPEHYATFNRWQNDPAVIRNWIWPPPSFVTRQRTRSGATDRATVLHSGACFLTMSSCRTSLRLSLP